MGILANDGMKRKIICIVFMAMVFYPSSALIMRAGYAGFLAALAEGEINNFLLNLMYELDSAISNALDYGPGIVTYLRFDLSNGFSLMVLLTVWNTNTCNLGRGGEARNPMAPMAGRDLRRLTNTLLPSIRDLVTHRLGYGFAIDERVSLFYFPFYTYLVSGPSDNDPTNRQHQYFEVDSLRNSSSQTTGGSLASSNSNDTSFFIISTTNISIATVSTSSVFTLPALPKEPGVVSTASNITNGTTLADNRKFPIDPFGDCDLPSLLLVLANGPTYDDQSTHGLQLLNPTDKIWSPNARFMLVMQLDCNLVLYDTKAQTSLWASVTEDKGSICYAALTLKGELIVYDQTPDNVLFRTFTGCTGNGGDCWTNTLLQVQDDGNMVLYIFDTGYPMFASNTVVCEGGCE